VCISISILVCMCIRRVIVFADQHNSARIVFS